MKKNENGRIQYIDYLKALAMILVILGHVNFANQWLKEWIYSFHMPLFFFASGLVLQPEQRFSWTDFREQLRKNFYRLFVPYMVWALIFADFSFVNILKIIYGSYSMISGTGSLTSLWFLPVMLLSVTAVYFLSFLTKGKLNNIQKILLSIAAFVIGALLPQFSIGYPWSVNVFFVAFGFMMLGNSARSVLDKTLCSPVKGVRYCILKLLGFLACTVCGYYLAGFNETEYGYVLMGKAEYGNFILFLLCAFLGIIGMLLLSSLIETIIKARLLSFIGQNTLCIFIVQKPIIALFKKLFEYVSFPSWVQLSVTLAGTLAVSCLIAMILNRFIPWLVGKKMPS